MVEYLTSMFKALCLVPSTGRSGLYFRSNLVAYAHNSTRVRQEITVSFKLIQMYSEFHISHLCVVRVCLKTKQKKYSGVQHMYSGIESKDSRSVSLWNKNLESFPWKVSS